jgi:peptidyl-prolyl cis-trans isomerase B (cyclophilin B)
MPEPASFHQSSYPRLSAPRLWGPLLILSLLPALACGRYRARHELERDECFARIIQRVDRRSMGEDSLFENNLLANPYPEVRERCAVALGQIGSPRGLPLLFRAVHTGDTAVRAASAFAIGQIEDRERLINSNLEPDPQATKELLFLLRDPSLTVQMRAIEALGKTGSHPEATEIVQRLERFPYRGSVADRAYIGFGITALARLKDPVALPELERLANADNSEIRSRASEALAILTNAAVPPPPTAAGEIGDQRVHLTSASDAASLALAVSRRNSTIAVVQTTRGTIEIELFRKDSPLTVANFVLRAIRGNYSGFVFDQVVPGQKIEGKISASQSSFNLSPQGEINLRPFERGSVGLSFADENSPSGRFFIALAPQPYLDGIDTCFGRVISGIQIADRLSTGDRILSIYIEDTVDIGDRIRY